jgi:hypothetical protein
VSRKALCVYNHTKYINVIMFIRVLGEVKEFRMKDRNLMVCQEEERVPPNSTDKHYTGMSSKKRKNPNEKEGWVGQRNRESVETDEGNVVVQGDEPPENSGPYSVQFVLNLGTNP